MKGLSNGPGQPAAAAGEGQSALARKEGFVPRLTHALTQPFFHVWVLGPGVAVYGIVLALMGKLRIEHVLILGAWLVMNYVPRLRGILRGLLPFFLFGIIYDALRFITPALHRLIPPHAAGPYLLERHLFGVTLQNGQIALPTDLLAQVHSTGLLLATGFAYFFYIYEVFLFGIVLLFVDRDLLRRFGWAFFGLCMLGIVTYYVYPAAPPWYVEKYGLGPVDLAAPSSAARLVEVDALLGTSLFADIYSRSSNVFGAIPSLHAAYPLIVWLYARKLRLIGRWHWLFLGFWALVSFSAVFLGHHYVIDVMLGWLYAGLSYVVAEELLHRRWPGFTRARSFATTPAAGADDAAGPALLE